MAHTSRLSRAIHSAQQDVRECRVCGCTEATPCIVAGAPCSWVAPNLCSNPECLEATAAEIGGAMVRAA